jgi:ankyrin repeat protein
MSSEVASRSSHATAHAHAAADDDNEESVDDRVDELVAAARGGRLGTVRTLVADGVPADIAGRFGFSALHEAVRSHRTSVLHCLLANGRSILRVNAADDRGLSALDYAIVHGNILAIPSLMEHGAKVNEQLLNALRRAQSDDSSDDSSSNSAEREWLAVLKQRGTGGALGIFGSSYKATCAAVEQGYLRFAVRAAIADAVHGALIDDVLTILFAYTFEQE